jgi:hypothetical protein
MAESNPIEDQNQFCVPCDPCDLIGEGIFKFLSFQDPSLDSSFASSIYDKLDKHPDGYDEFILDVADRLHKFGLKCYLEDDPRRIRVLLFSRKICALYKESLQFPKEN